MVAMFPELVDDFLDALRAAKRSEHTLRGYRNDLYGIAGRIVASTASVPPDLDTARADESSEPSIEERVARLAVDELNPRALRRGFGSWASHHAEGSPVRAGP